MNTKCDFLLIHPVILMLNVVIVKSKNLLGTFLQIVNSFSHYSTCENLYFFCTVRQYKERV